MSIVYRVMFFFLALGSLTPRKITHILSNCKGKNQLSSDKYIVPGSFLSGIQRDIYHCSWVEEREGVSELVREKK